MTILRREAFLVSLEEGVRWYASQRDLGPDAAAALAERFAGAVDTTIERIARGPSAGPRWIYRNGYRFRLVAKPFRRWLVFYRQPEPQVVELVDLIRGERNLPERVR